MQDYPGKYFIRRDMSSSYYADDTYKHRDISVLEPCEASASPEVLEDEQYRPVRIARPYAYKTQWLKKLAANLSPAMRRSFFTIGASCHQGGIHRARDIVGPWNFLAQTLLALERRHLIIFHGGQYSNQRIEMTDFGKELWHEVFEHFVKRYYGGALDDVLSTVFAFEYWGEKPEKKAPPREEYALFSIGE